MRCRPGAFVTVTLVFYCYSEAKEFTYQGGKEKQPELGKNLVCEHNQSHLWC